MVTVGISGATGFIGGALVPRLVADGYDLVLVDDHSGLVRVDPTEAQVESEDFASDQGLRLLSGCDVVLHLGAVSGVMICAQDPIGTARVNIDGTRRLVEACAARNVPLAFASSFAVVGRPDQLPVTEETPAHPTHEYARQKAEGERLTRTLPSGRTVPNAVVRMSNVYGSYSIGGRTVAKGNVISLFVQQASSGRLQVNAPGTQRRNFVHIDDVVSHWAAVVRFLRDHSGGDSYVFNCASDESYSVLEVAKMFSEIWLEARPHAPALAIDVVPNPRAAIELVDPDFSVQRDLTERLLGMYASHRVSGTIRTLLGPTSPS